MNPSQSSSWTDESRSFLTGDNALYVAHLYATYLENSNAVSDEWQQYFSSLKDKESEVLKELSGPSWVKPQIVETKPLLPAQEAAPEDVKKAVLNSIRAIMLIRAYRARGHEVADLDPLKLAPKGDFPELDPATYGFTEEDYDTPIFIYDVLGVSYATLREILRRLHQAYCGTIGIEFLHIQDPERKLWLQKRIEGNGEVGLGAPLEDPQQKKAILEKVIEAESFEKFLHTKFPAAKRFGLDGGESLIPGLEDTLLRSAELGVEEVVIGMSHRGRLNVLTNILSKPYQAIFSEFEGINLPAEDIQGSGDVKYHLGTSTDRMFNGHKVHLSLTPNPSHLEAVDPVVAGKVRAKQGQLADITRTKVMGLLMHGDAAFVGQGVVAETFLLSQLNGYQTGGTFHVIINNQIGFTTSPNFARSTTHASDLGMMVEAPIFRVNADDPEAVVKVMKLAAEYRHVFGSDVIVDFVCYRRFGHNEVDEPSFTQPLMYQAIKNHPSTVRIYKDRLIAEGILTEDEAQEIERSVYKRLHDSFEDLDSYQAPEPDWLSGRWGKFTPKTKDGDLVPTGVNKKTLVEMGTALSKIPQSFHLHPKLERFLSSRKLMVEDEAPIDWSMGEALAFGSLLLESYGVRLSGQDSGRGTFSQRHAVLRDQTTEERYISLNHLATKQGHFEVWDSPLAEASVLGFELGYSLADPMTLVLWEAQFGDFANGAQVMIDQFLSAGEMKWLRMMGLVLLLPHGHEGQGPEHTSARLERFLQLCGEDNMEVVNCTTPASYFHVLRRQMHRSYRKPLIIMTPKSLLRHKLATSSIRDFETGTRFLNIIPDSIPPSDHIHRVVLCSGKVYYDLLEKREAESIKHIAIIRLEQLYPFPHDELVKLLGSYKKAHVVWCQEEPGNMGAWTYIDRKLEAVLIEAKMSETRPIYVGRPEAASPATGLLSRHQYEQSLLVDQALNLIK